MGCISSLSGGKGFSMISASRLMKLGLSREDAAFWLGITTEQLDARIAGAEARRAEPVRPGRTLMTPLLARPDLDRWEMRTAERL